MEFTLSRENATAESLTVVNPRSSKLQRGYIKGHIVSTYLNDTSVFFRLVVSLCIMYLKLVPF
jgi:hypothetical protein